MRKHPIRPSTIVIGLAAGVSGGVASVIQQGIGSANGGSILSVAIDGVAGAYIAVMVDVILQ